MTPLYRYRAARPDGRLLRGEAEAVDRVQAAALLRAQGLHPIGLDPVTDHESRRRAAPRRELATVFRSLASLVSAGVPLERAIRSTEPLASPRLRGCLAASGADLRAGRGFAQALSSGRGLVPATVLGVIRAGERVGRLGPALEQVALQLEQEAELEGDIRQALAYPALLTLTGLVSVLLIGGVVLPRFALLLGELGHGLPASTRLLLAVFHFISHHWLLLVALAVGSVLGFACWSRGQAGQRRLHETLLQVPLIGPVRHGLATARATRAIGGALTAGMPLLPALEVGAGAAGDTAVSARLGYARERVARGETLAHALAKERALTTTGLQLLEVGEQSAQLAVMAARAAELAGRDCARRLGALVAVVEPAIVIALGGMVAFIAVALLQALYGIRPGQL